MDVVDKKTKIGTNILLSLLCSFDFKVRWPQSRHSLLCTEGAGGGHDSNVPPWKWLESYKGGAPAEGQRGDRPSVRLPLCDPGWIFLQYALHTHSHIYKYTMHIQTKAHKFARVRTHMQICKHICTHGNTKTDENTHLCKHRCISTHIHAHIHTQIYTYIHTNTHMYTHNTAVLTQRELQQKEQEVFTSHSIHKTQAEKNMYLLLAQLIKSYSGVQNLVIQGSRTILWPGISDRYVN